MRRIITSAFIALLVLGSAAMSRSPEVLTFACRAEGHKAELPENLCVRFAERLAAAHPGRVSERTATDSAAIVLVVKQGTSSVVTARIDVGEARGEPLGAASRGGPISDTALDRLLDALIARTEF